MVSTYPTCFYEGNEGYSVIFPDFNYLSTCGTALQEAEKIAVDCLAGALYSAKIDGEEICKPSSIEKNS